MTDFIASLMTKSLKRLILMLISGAIVTLNHKLGLNLSAEEVATLMAGTLGFVTVSAIREGRPPSGPALMQMIQAGIEQAMTAQPAKT